jgi:hypothetical protein
MDLDFIKMLKMEHLVAKITFSGIQVFMLIIIDFQF